MQTERLRAQRRAWVRDYAKNEWRTMKENGQAWKVERFIALIGVAYPSRSNIFPARAAETVKPIIDAGRDAKLWDDDDSQHRHSTVYIQLPEPAPPNHYRLTVIIIPVPDKLPKYQITSRLAANIEKHWRQQSELPDWHDGYSVSFTVPDKQWITSNFTDSDLMARQKGARKASTWGRGTNLGIRERVKKTVDRTSRQIMESPSVPPLQQIRCHCWHSLPVRSGHRRPGQRGGNREHDIAGWRHGRSVA